MVQGKLMIPPLLEKVVIRLGRRATESNLGCSIPMWKDATPSVEEDHFCGHNPINWYSEKARWVWEMCVLSAYCFSNVLFNFPVIIFGWFYIHVWFLIFIIQSLLLGLESVLLRISYSSACGCSLNSLWTAFISYLNLPIPWLPSLSKENCLGTESPHSQMWVTEVHLTELHLIAVKAHSYPILTRLSLVSLPTYHFP